MRHFGQLRWRSQGAVQTLAVELKTECSPNLKAARAYALAGFPARCGRLSGKTSVVRII